MIWVRQYLIKNKTLFFSVAVIWLTACICGIFYGARLGGNEYADVSAYVRETLSDGSGIWQMLKNGTVINFRFLIALLISSSLILFIPLTVGIIAFKGFASGFTVSLIIRLYKFKGAMLSLGTIVLPYSLAIPMYFVIFTAALKYPVESRKSASKQTVSEKRKEWFSYVVMQLILTLVLCLITLFEAVLTQAVLWITNI